MNWKIDFEGKKGMWQEQVEGTVCTQHSHVVQSSGAGSRDCAMGAETGERWWGAD